MKTLPQLHTLDRRQAGIKAHGGFLETASAGPDAPRLILVAVKSLGEPAERYARLVVSTCAEISQALADDSPGRLTG